MAKVNINVTNYRGKPKKRRKGIHAKTKASKSKNSLLYKKVNVGQG